MRDGIYEVCAMVYDDVLLGGEGVSPLPRVLVVCGRCFSLCFMLVRPIWQIGCPQYSCADGAFLLALPGARPPSPGEGLCQAVSRARPTAGRTRVHLPQSVRRTQQQDRTARQSGTKSKKQNKRGHNVAHVGTLRTPPLALESLPQSQRRDRAIGEGAPPWIHEFSHEKSVSCDPKSHLRGGFRHTELAPMDCSFEGGKKARGEAGGRHPENEESSPPSPRVQLISSQAQTPQTCVHNTG